MSLLRYLPENCDELMHDFNQHVQKENVVMTFSLCTVFCLKHMIDDVLNLLSESYYYYYYSSDKDASGSRLDIYLTKSEFN